MDRTDNKKHVWDNIRAKPSAATNTDEVYAEMTRRMLGVYSREEQQRIRGATIAIIGVGCIGGMDAYILARMGIGRLVLVDFDKNELSNLNRQPMATFTTLEIPKVYAAKTIIRDINPLVDVVPFDEPATEDNHDRLLAGVDVVLQATDSMVARIVTARACQKLKIPCIVMTGQPPFRTIVSTLMPGGPNYEELFGIDFVKGKTFASDPSLDERVRALKHERAEHAARRNNMPEWLAGYKAGTEGWGVTPERAYLTSVYQAHEALAIVTGRTPKAIAPKAYVSDLNGLADLDRPDSMVAVLNPPNGKHWDYRWF